MAKIDVSFQVEIDDEQLKEHGLSLDDVVESMYLKNDGYSDGVMLSSGIEQCDVMVDYRDCFSDVLFEKHKDNTKEVSVDEKRKELLNEIAELDGGQIDFSKFDMNFLRGANKEFEIVCNWDEIANYMEGYYPELIEDFDKIDEATINSYAETIYEHILESDYVNTLICEEKNEFIGDEIMPLIKDEIASMRNDDTKEQDRNAIAAEVDKDNKDNISREDR